MINSLRRGLSRAVGWGSHLRPSLGLILTVSALGLLVLGGAIAVAMGSRHSGTDPIADATGTATATPAWTEAGETFSPAPPIPTASSATLPATPTPEQTTPQPTATLTPAPTSAPTLAPTFTPRPTTAPTPTPPTPGTLTFRLEVDAVPETTASLNVYVVTVPAQPRYFGMLQLCRRWGDVPCRPGTYEVALTGLAVGTRVYYALWEGTVTTEGSAFSQAASHVADGSTILLEHLGPAPATGAVTFRLRLTSIPSGTLAYTLYAPHREGAPDRYELCGPSTGPCVPGTEELTLADYQPRFTPFAYFAVERTTATGEVRVTNAGVTLTGGPAVELPNPPAGLGPIAFPTSPLCAAASEDDPVTGWVGWTRSSWRTFTTPPGLCVSSLTLGAFATPGIGTITLDIDGTPTFLVDLGRWDTYGVDGASSGDRVIALTVPMWVAPGQTLALDYGSCVACETVSVQVRGTQP